MVAAARDTAARDAKGNSAQAKSAGTPKQGKPAARPAGPPPLTPAAVNDAAFPTISSRGIVPPAALLRTQILLDRAHFSPGEIDAAAGSNLQKAVMAYQQQNGLQPNGLLDAPTWTALNQDTAPALVDYTITAADVAGPFLAIPTTMADKAKLPAMSYSSPLEALAERFHASPKLLQRLNPRRDFGREGEIIVVPNVEVAAALPKFDSKSAKVVVRKSVSAVLLVDANDRVLAYFPASVGSEHDPLPIGNWKINGVSRNPKFHYNPKLFWDAEADEKRATIPPGPNGPVGVVWIDLSKPHYGIHGTPEPSAIGRTQSHGCIRLTNWDATALANAISPGTLAVLEE